MSIDKLAVNTRELFSHSNKDKTILDLYISIGCIPPDYFKKVKIDHGGCSTVFPISLIEYPYFHKI